VVDVDARRYCNGSNAQPVSNTASPMINTPRFNMTHLVSSVSIATMCRIERRGRSHARGDVFARPCMCENEHVMSFIGPGVSDIYDASDESDTKEDRAISVVRRSR